MPLILFHIFHKFNFEVFYLKIFLLEPTLFLGMRYWDIDPYQNMFCKPEKAICHPSICHRCGGCRKPSFFLSLSSKCCFWILNNKSLFFPFIFEKDISCCSWICKKWKYFVLRGENLQRKSDELYLQSELYFTHKLGKPGYFLGPFRLHNEEKKLPYNNSEKYWGALWHRSLS